MTTIPTYEQIDAMVEGDPLLLRDLAWDLAQRLETAEQAIANALAVSAYDVGGERQIAAHEARGDDATTGFLAGVYLALGTVKEALEPTR